MLIKKVLLKKADVYTRTKGPTFFHVHYKPLNTLQILGILLIALLIVGNIALLLSADTHSVKEAETATWNNNNQTNSNQWVNIVPINTSPMPLISPIPTTPPQPNGQDVSGISAQIIATQQQVTSLMQTCVNNAQQMANQIINYTNQLQQLQNQLNALNNQSQNVDTGSSSGQQQQNQLNQQTQQLQNEINNLNTTISNAQNNYNNANSQCQQDVSNIEQQRGTLESNLDNAFSTDMNNIQLPQ